MVRLWWLFAAHSYQYFFQELVMKMFKWVWQWFFKDICLYVYSVYFHKKLSCLQTKLNNHDIYLLLFYKVFKKMGTNLRFGHLFTKGRRFIKLHPSYQLWDGRQSEISACGCPAYTSGWGWEAVLQSCGLREGGTSSRELAGETVGNSVPIISISFGRKYIL